MITLEAIIKSVKTLMLATAIVLTMAQCSEEEIVAQEAIGEDVTTEMSSITAEVGSLSVSGLYTEVQGDVECASCTYVVDPNETTVDGNGLGLKPGSVVCIRKALKYGSIDFVNMEGTAESPIVIGYCGE